MCIRDSDITIVSREDGSGTRGAFIELFGIEEKKDGEKVDMTTDDAQITNSTSVMLTTVAGDDYAIGYVSLGSLNDTVKALKIDGEEATEQNIKDGKYKICRPFNIATKKGCLLYTSGSNALDFVIDNYHYDSILYNKELYCEENILLAVPKHFAVNEELGMYQLSYKNIKNKNYLNQNYPAVTLGRFADLPFIMLTQGNDTRTRGDRLCRNVGFKPNIVLEFNQQSTAYMLSLIHI